MAENTQPLKTSLYQECRKCGARIMDFYPTGDVAARSSSILAFKKSAERHRRVDGCDGHVILFEEIEPDTSWFTTNPDFRAEA